MTNQSLQGGSPIGCAAALAVLEVIDEENLCERAVEIGDRIVDRLRAVQEKYPQRIGEIRHQGAMIAMELAQDGDADRPDPALTKAIVGEAAANGLILLSCGVRGT